MARTPRRSAPLDVDIFCRALGIDPDEVSDGSIVIIPEFGTSKVTLHWEGVKQVEQVQLDRATDLARRAGGDQ